MARLTAKTVENWKPKEKRQEVPDERCTGLYFIVQPNGKKSWTVRYRAGGKHRRMTLGKYPSIGLKEARDKANEILAGAMEGADPAAERQAAKQAHLNDRDKVSVLFEQYCNRHLSNLRSGQTVAREMERHVVSQWGDRDIHDINKRDVIDILDGLMDAGKATTANRVRTYISGFCNWLVDRDVLDSSPAMGVKRPAKEQSRDRVLSDDEIRLFWQACEDVGFPYGPMGKVLLLTGQRLGEVVGMSEREVQGDLWHLPADRVKNGREHTVPLSPAVRGVLADMVRVPSDRGLYFTTNGITPVSGFHKARNYIADRMIELANDDLQHWTFHDLRRTAATGMARLGTPVHITEHVLNHVSGTRAGIVSVYQRHQYADEKRLALDSWARFVADLVTGERNNVVPLAR